MKEKITKTFFYVCLVVPIVILAFYIMHNAQWLVGDDAIIIRHTGWGAFFNPADTINPHAGRFYPLAYFAYNILPLIGLFSVNAHFGLHCVFFSIFAICSIWMMLKSIDTKQSAWKHIAIFAFVIISIQRAYSSFLDGFSTIWIDYTLLMVWMLISYYVHKQQSQTALVIGLISVAYLTCCLEANFVLPLCYGIIGILFSWKSSTKLERIYFVGLTGIAVAFLIVYFFTCYIYIEQAYDGSHGSDVSLLQNAIKMFVAQKILWVGLIVLIWRIYCVFLKKEQYEFWDTMIAAGFAFCCGCAILKLNWTMYYTMASLIILPSIAHYSIKYLNEKIVVVVFVFLALFMCRKLPKQIRTNQESRLETTIMMNTIEKLYKQGQVFYWFEPIDEKMWCYDKEIRAWQRESLQTQIGWQVGNEIFKFNMISDFDSENMELGLYFVPQVNNKFTKNVNEKILTKGEIIIGNTNSDITGVLIK